MVGRGAQLPQRGPMLVRSVPFVALKSVATVAARRAHHDPVPGDLGDDRCGRHAGDHLIALAHPQRRSGVSSLESARPSIGQSAGRITAAATSGPASAPRPASSTPATRAKPTLRSRYSRMAVASTSESRTGVLYWSRRSQPVWLSGQMRTKARPTRVDRSIGPKVRESSELLRLSPITKSLPAGTVVGVQFSVVVPGAR